MCARELLTLRQSHDPGPGDGRSNAPSLVLEAADKRAVLGGVVVEAEGNDPVVLGDGRLASDFYEIVSGCSDADDTRHLREFNGQA